MNMNTWFECKVRYEKTLENGTNKKITELYLVDALSFTEAEAKIIEEMTPFISGEFTVANIKRANYSEIFPSNETNADKWYDCKLEFIILDEKSGVEKKTKTTVLIQAFDLRDAMKKLDEGMKGTMEDYNAVCIKETSIMDVYPYEEENTVQQKSEDKIFEKEVNDFLHNVEKDNNLTISISTSQSENKITIDKKMAENDIRGDD